MCNQTVSLLGTKRSQEGFWVQQNHPEENTPLIQKQKKKKTFPGEDIPTRWGREADHEAPEASASRLKVKGQHTEASLL